MIYRKKQKWSMPMYYLKKDNELLKVFISSRCGEGCLEYTIVRRALKELLENTQMITSYVFEDTFPTTGKIVPEYLKHLDDSDICLFLIDNYDEKISEGLYTEIQRARATKKKSIYIFLNDETKDITQIQQDIINEKGVKMYVVHDFQELISVGYRSVLNDVLDKYHDYCLGRLLPISEEEFESVNLDVDAFKIIERAIPRQLLVGFDETQNKIVELMRDWAEPIKKTSGLDTYCANFLDVLLGKKKILSFNTALLLDELQKRQPKELTQVIEKRWKSIQAYYLDDLDLAIRILKELYNSIENKFQYPLWLKNDILIDLRNFEIMNGNQNAITIYPESQTILDKSDAVVYYPTLDRFSENFYKEICEEHLKEYTKMPQTHILGNGIRTYAIHMTNCYVTAIYNGSWTQLAQFVHKLKYCVFEMIKNYDSTGIIAEFYSICIIDDNVKEFEKAFYKFGHLLHHCTHGEIREIYDRTNSIPLKYKRDKWKISVFKYLGYYFSDEDYLEISTEVVKIIESWTQSDNSLVSLGQGIIEALIFNHLRYDQEEICAFAVSWFQKEYKRYYCDLFKLLSYIDYTKIPETTTKALVTEITKIAGEGSQLDNQLFLEMLLSMRRCPKYTAKIDALVSKYSHGFYKETYELEIGTDLSQLIFNQIDKIQDRNIAQGKNGIIHSYGDYPYNIINNIIRQRRFTIRKSILISIIKVAKATLFSATQTINEKSQALQLLICLKLKKHRFMYDWDVFYKEILNNYSIVTKTSFPDFEFECESRYLLEFNLLLFNIAFGNYEIDTLFDLLSVYNEIDPHEKIIVFESLKMLLSSCDIEVMDSVISTALLQFIIGNCHSDIKEVRLNALVCLVEYTDTKYGDSVVKQIARMIDDEDYKIRLCILKHKKLIKKKDRSLYNHIVGKAKTDAHYLVRKAISI